MNIIKGAAKLRMSHISTEIREQVINIQSSVDPVNKISCCKRMSQIIWSRTDIVNITFHFFLKDVRSMQHSVMNHSIVVA